jgi:hypothetical protein
MRITSKRKEIFMLETNTGGAEEDVKIQLQK